MIDIGDPPVAGGPSVSWIGMSDFGKPDRYRACLGGHIVEGPSRQETLKALDERCGTNFASTDPYQ